MNYFSSQFYAGFPVVNLGWDDVSPGGFKPNAAATWGAVSYVPTVSKTINSIRLYFYHVFGTLSAGDITCAIYSDTGSSAIGAPNVSLATSSTTSPSPPASSTWVDFTGFTLAVTAGTKYWFVISNGNATPGTNYPNISMLGSSDFSQGLGYDRTSSSTTNSGTSWTNNGSDRATTFRVGFSDSTYDGQPVYYDTVAAGTFRAYYQQEWGVLFTSPSNADMNVIGVGFPIKVASATGNAFYKLYNGTTLLGSTGVIAPGEVSSSSNFIPLYFSSAITVPHNSTIRATVANDSATDTSTKYYSLSYIGKWDSDTNSQSLKPFGGSMDATYGFGTSWTDSTTYTVPFMLILDPVTPFASITPALASILPVERGLT